MNLSFIGRGSAFNTIEGNNNAFYLNDKGQMLLIDCGETTFTRLKEKGILNEVKELFVAITHTHSDHVGSLSSLILYLFFALNKRPNLILTGDETYNRTLKDLIKIMGLSDDNINFITTNEFAKEMVEFKTFEFVESGHVDNFKTFGIVYTTDNGITYYSSDTNSTECLETYLNNKYLDKIYIDISIREQEGNSHLSFDTLLKVVPKEKRNKVYTMHFDSAELIQKAIGAGFKVVDKI